MRCRFGWVRVSMTCRESSGAAVKDIASADVASEKRQLPREWDYVFCKCSHSNQTPVHVGLHGFMASRNRPCCEPDSCGSQNRGLLCFAKSQQTLEFLQHSGLFVACEDFKRNANVAAPAMQTISICLFRVFNCPVHLS